MTVQNYGPELMGAGVKGKRKVKRRKNTKAKKIIAGIATGGISTLFDKKSKAGRAGRALITGGASELFAKGKKGKKIRRAFAAISTGGASELFQKGKKGALARAIATGGISAVELIKKRKVKAKKTAGVNNVVASGYVNNASADSYTEQNYGSNGGSGYDPEYSAAAAEQPELSQDVNKEREQGEPTEQKSGLMKWAIPAAAALFFFL